MGWDSVKPFVTGKYEAKGAFILCKTSNPSSSEMQLLNLANGRTLFEEVLHKVQQWNRNLGGDRLCIVAGATDIPSLATLRQQAPNIWILCPGVGAQGGEPEAVCKAGLRADGGGLLISVSRALSAAPNLPQAAEKLRDEINALRAAHTQLSVKEVSLQDFQRTFLSFALQQQALKFGSFKLKSGRLSPYFFNAGSFCSGQSLQVLGRCYAQAVRASGIEFDVFFGPAYKGIPLVTAMSSAYFSLYNVSVDLAYNRKEAKDHGEGGVLVGAPLSGRRVLIVDDVITAGTAIRESVDLLNHAGAIITGVVLCLDRQERASDDTSLSAVQQVVRDFNIPVFSIVTLQHLIAFLQEGGQGVDVETMQAYRHQYGAAL
ncbi:orotate phosphoribosyltransferase [archaeon]|nr:MAG: orotate phosphoribosyltransferase [archaeon]